MELLTNDLIIDHIAGNAAAQTLVEGELPLPEGHPAAASILDQSGEVVLTGVETLSDKLMLDGTLTADIICAAPDGTPFAFRSGTSFRHTMAVPGADAGLEGVVLPVLQSLTCTLENGAVKLSAVIDFNCRVQSREPIRSLTGIQDVRDLLTKPLDIHLCRRRSSGKANIRIREELAAAGVTEVICARAKAIVNSLSSAQEGAAVEGTMQLSALCRDGSGRLSQLNQQFPFGDLIPMEFSSEPMDAEVQVNACALRCMGENTGILAAEAELTLELFTYEKDERTAVMDAYSPSVPLECTRREVTVFSELPAVEKRVSLRENVAIPTGWPAIERCIYTNAHPVITGCSMENGQLSLDGLLITRIVYECAEGKLHAFSEDVPFLLSLELPSEAADADTKVVCLSSSATGSGSAADVNYSLHLSARPLVFEELALVTGAAVIDMPPPPRGILLYFAGSGETLWDVAKRFGTTPDVLKASNPDLEDTLVEGQRLLFFLKRQA